MKMYFKVDKGFEFADYCLRVYAVVGIMLLAAACCTAIWGPLQYRKLFCISIICATFVGLLGVLPICHFFELLGFRKEAKRTSRFMEKITQSMCNEIREQKKIEGDYYHHINNADTIERLIVEYKKLAKDKKSDRKIIEIGQLTAIYLSEYDKYSHMLEEK